MNLSTFRESIIQFAGSLIIDYLVYKPANQLTE